MLRGWTSAWAPGARDEFYPETPVSSATWGIASMLTTAFGVDPTSFLQFSYMGPVSPDGPWAPKAYKCEDTLGYITPKVGATVAGTTPVERLDAMLRRHLGTWGLLHPGNSSGFYERLVAGEMGYKVAARFQSPISAFVPEVAESVNRTIVILRRDGE